jgi:hypothetical protein
MARLTLKPGVGFEPPTTAMTASWANKPVRPPNRPQVLEASFFGIKPHRKIQDISSITGPHSPEA